MVDIRRQLHAEPELSFEEVTTTRLIRSRLDSLGLTEERCPTATGAVASLTGGRPGETVLLRADIDALPVTEAPGLPFASRTQGRMHACGHDAHVAILLGAAAALSARAEDLPGRYLFVFQPAEEQISGAQAMLEGGLLDTAHPTQAVGCHVIAQVPVGTLVARPGVAMAAAHGIRVTMSGSGGHGALQPRRGNVVLAISRLADRLDTVVSGLSFEGADCVCSPGLIRTGTANNVVPTTAEMAASLRTFTAGQQAEAWARLEQLARAVAAEFDVEAHLEVSNQTGPVSNDAAVTGRILDVARRVLPDHAVMQAPSPIAASDDVSAILEQVPGCYFFVGAGRSDGTSGMHHSPAFAIDEQAIRAGSKVMAAAALELAQPSPR